MSRKVIFKITDPVQYKLSVEHKIRLKHLVSQSNKKTFFKDENYHRVFSAVDAVETNDSFDPKNFYIFPIFYNHAENLDTLENWRKEVKLYITKNVDTFNCPNIRVCLCDPYETSKHFVESVKLISSMIDIEIIVITANKKFPTNIKNVVVIYNDLWMEKFPACNNILDYVPDKLYINLNRQARYHRCLLMDALIKNNLFNRGYNTWGNLSEGLTNYKELHPDSMIDQQSFFTLDVEDFENINPNYFVPIEQCKKSFLFLNTETNIDSDQLFFSEKVYKPIGIGLPFLILGNPGTLEDLQYRGFLTFNEWFDESYDKTIDLKQRVDIIIKNINKYSQYSNQDLSKIRLEMREILNHNLQLYKILKRKNWLAEKISLLAESKT